MDCANHCALKCTHIETYHTVLKTQSEREDSPLYTADVPLRAKSPGIIPASCTVATTPQLA
jgi:hypothetical protein